MNCSQCQELLAEYAIDTLPAEVRAEVSQHLATGCAVCASALEQLTEGWAALPATLSPVTPPADLKQELLQRARDSKLSPAAEKLSDAWSFTPVGEPESIQRLSGGNSKFWRTALFYVAASLLGAFCGYYFSRDFSSQQTRQQLAAEYQQQTQRFEQTFGNNEVYLSAFEAAEDQTTVQGHFIWDRTADQLHVYALDLGQKPDDTEFRVWLVSSEEQWSSIGVLTPHDDGVSSAVFQVLHLPAKLTRAVITVEPLGAEPSDKPQGPVRFSGVFH